MKYCVIFDMDGTLFETGEGIIYCARYALECVGEPIPADEVLSKFIGPSLFDSFTETIGMSEERALKAIEHYRKRYREGGVDMSRPYDGIEDMLGRLKACGFVLSVASSKPLTMVKYLLDKHDLHKYFARVIAPDFATRSSDKSELVRAACVGDANIMVGDTVFDIEGAHGAGVKAIAVSYGYGKPDTLTAAEYIAATPAEICDIAVREREKIIRLEEHIL